MATDYDLDEIDLKQLFPLVREEIARQRAVGYSRARDRFVTTAGWVSNVTRQNGLMAPESAPVGVDDEGAVTTSFPDDEGRVRRQLVRIAAVALAALMARQENKVAGAHQPGSGY